MYFESDTSLLDAAQALCVALPAAGLPVWLARLGGRGWSLVAPLSVIATVVAISLTAASADVFTWIALILVPPGCALALGWAAHGARPWMAVLVAPLLAAALVAPDDPLGRMARLALIVGSCVTAGRLLAGAAPLAFLKVGVVAMATIDAVFIFGDYFGDQNAQFNAAAPAAELPRLQVADIGDVSTDYGDFFVAGLVGGILAAERSPQAIAAIATFVAAQAFNQLFAVVDSLPGTVPPAIVMLAFSLARHRAKPHRLLLFDSSWRTLRKPGAEQSEGTRMNRSAGPDRYQAVRQYSRGKILGVWAAAALPMGLLAWVVAPLLDDQLGGRDPFAEALLICLTAGLIWQFILVMILVRQEIGSLARARVREALWLQRPRDSKADRAGGRVWPWVLLFVVLVGIWSMVPAIPGPDVRDLGDFLGSDRAEDFFSGNWGWFAVVVVLAVFNTVLGEELLFRGLLLPRMRDAFGDRDWVANGSLFALYHLHVPWVIPATLVEGIFLEAYPSRRFQSAWMGIIVHSMQSVFIIGIVLALVLS